MLSEGALIFMPFNSFVPIKEIDAHTLCIHRDTSGILKLKIKGQNEEYAVRPIRCFPLTGAEYYLAIFKITPEGALKEEIALVADFNRLDENARKILDEELSKAYSLNWIKKIHSVEQTKRTLKWRVDTDKGERTFEVRRFKDIYMPKPSLVAIKDAEGNVFLINTTQLDSKSLTLLEIYG